MGSCILTWRLCLLLHAFLRVPSDDAHGSGKYVEASDMACEKPVTMRNQQSFSLYSPLQVFTGSLDRMEAKPLRPNSVTVPWPGHWHFHLGSLYFQQPFDAEAHKAARQYLAMESLKVDSSYQCLPAMRKFRDSHQMLLPGLLTQENLLPGCAPSQPSSALDGRQTLQSRWSSPKPFLSHVRRCGCRCGSCCTRTVWSGRRRACTTSPRAASPSSTSPRSTASSRAPGARRVSAAAASAAAAQPVSCLALLSHTAARSSIPVPVWLQPHLPDPCSNLLSCGVAPFFTLPGTASSRPATGPAGTRRWTAWRLRLQPKIQPHCSRSTPFSTALVAAWQPLLPKP